MNNRDELKTPDSVFTFGEIDDICKKMGWNHIEEYIKKYDYQNPPYWLCRRGSGYFIAKNGKEYYTWGTSRSSWWEIKPERSDYQERKNDLYKWVVSTEPTGLIQHWYANPPREYYLYDIVLENPWIHDSKKIAEILKEDPEKQDKSCDGEKFYHLVLFHLGIGKETGIVWEHKKKENEL